jgi:arylsulfatase A-like enzyme
LACVTAVDDNVGKIMDVINSSSLKENTVVILTSDHGWTMGEKDHIYKNSLWEESTRVPLIIRLPKNRMSNSVVEHPVSLIDIYPTLLDLAGIEDTNTKKNELGHGLDGNSLVPFLNNPNTTEWSGPEGALSVLYSGDVNKDIPSNHHYSVRTKNFRYIIYNSGQEELYETTTDPKEKNNLVFNASHPKIASLRMLMQQITYPIVPQGLKRIK